MVVKFTTAYKAHVVLPYGHGGFWYNLISTDNYCSLVPMYAALNCLLALHWSKSCSSNRQVPHTWQRPNRVKTITSRQWLQCLFFNREAVERIVCVWCPQLLTPSAVTVWRGITPPAQARTHDSVHVAPAAPSVSVHVLFVRSWNKTSSMRHPRLQPIFFFFTVTATKME